MKFSINTTNSGINISTGSGITLSSTPRPGKGRSIIDFPYQYCVVDLETSGLSPQWCSIIEIGAIRYKNGHEIERFHTLVQPPISEDGLFINEFIEELTGITNDMLANAPSVVDVLPRFLAFLGNDIILGYNVSFDVNFLYDACKRYLNTQFSNDYVDVMRLSKKIFPNLTHHRLKDMVNHYELVNQQEHRAIADCEVTNRVYQKLLDDGIVQYGNEEAIIQSFYSRRNWWQKVRANDIIGNEAKICQDCPLYQRHCVITGKLERFTRTEAMQLIADLGGIIDNTVTKSTNYLILGNNDYCTTIKGGKSTKQKKAETALLDGQDIEIIPENVFYDMIAEYVDESKSISDVGNMSETKQLSKDNTSPIRSVFGDLNYESVYKTIQEMIGHDTQNVKLHINQNSASVYMFKSVAFSIIINSRTQTIKTGSTVVVGYVPKIPGAKYEKNVVTIPLNTEIQYKDIISDLINEVYVGKRNSVNGEMIGCCDMFVMCSDALYCLKRDDPHYNGCLYRKNLEAGKIFYGKNKNI